ncbi:ABC-type Fe3+-hydroxamate transport system, periplasmic component [Thermoanaerobacter kivui]|uniref:ABC-type Fe3+-hydroxamate transport system, periplasmic component n=2 Tax=Thermoanaerobacter kivui TaxID=2325 RepID=A0A097ASP3_THEKI|nr:ABC-type Fe3+-hydroxamate transport system, periplasmic component [Thermoanaerobacter kivui]
MKKKICFLMIFVLLMSLLPAFGLANPVKAQETQVYLNGVKINTGDVLPFIENGRTMVPVRLFSENLGADVKWDDATQAVTIQGEDVSVKLTIGKKEAVVNGKNKTLDVAPVVLSGRTIVPLRFIAEAFGADVKWDKETSRAVVVWNIKIKDSTGNEVTLSASGLNRVVVISSNIAEAMRIIQVPDEFIVGVSDQVQKRTYLGFDNKPNVGSMTNPNIEKIAELKPQAVLLQGRYVSRYGEKIEALGIKAIGIDFYYLEKYDEDLKKTALLFNRGGKAVEFLNWKNEILSNINNRLTNIEDKEKPRIACLDLMGGFKEGQYKTFPPGSSYDQVIKFISGNNIAADLKPSESSELVSGEWLLQKNPEVIVFVYCSELGYTTNDYSGVMKLIDNIKKDPVLSKTDAVKNNRIYFINISNLARFTESVYFAKRLYPDRFKDVNPSQILKEYFEKWLGIPMKGVWAYPEP